MDRIIIILLLYIFGVAVYTYVVKNDAMHKYNPDTNIKEIAIDGMKGIAIGFSIVGALLCIISFLTNLIY